jgi:hypothetical protein
MIEPPKITHLGMKSGEWPVRAFTAEHQAAAYAAESDRHYIWAVEAITLGPRLTAEIIPASFKLRPA